MEIELKYIIPDEQTAQAIWDNQLFKDEEETNSRDEMSLHAKYFDTENYDLEREQIAYRVRREGDKHIASLKWKGHSEDGLHVREEINVPVDSQEPNLEVFRESRVGSEALDFLKDKELKCLLETKVRRRNFRIDTGKGIYEISIDYGEIVTEGGNTPISEVEIELFSGEEDELKEIGRKLQDSYNLIPENDSKYARGMKLINEN
ncbi:MAG: CYTH domain-containing protein, partial [Bacillota bacterium]|nr:CYTH domain-containing protein [Bacillota bacterium]